VTRLTLDIQPTFDLRQDAFIDLPWAAALSNLDAIMSSAYSVSMMTSWSGETIGRLWVKTRIGDEAPPLTAVHLGATATPHVSANTRNVVLNRLTPFGGAGPWSERLPHFRIDADLDPAQIQSEYMVPRSNAVAALKLLRAMGGRIDAHLQLTEIRSMAGDTLWLSPSHGHDTVALHFTWRREPKPVAAITREIEDQLIPLGARPHWGKLMHARADVIAGLYPRLPAFRELARAYDPAGKFRNEFLDNHVFGAMAADA